MLPGALIFQVSCTRWPLWIIIGGTTFPKALTNENGRRLALFQRYLLKCPNIFIPRTLISLGIFWTPVSSPDQICAGETIPTFICIFFNRSNHWLITVGFAPIAHAIDRFLALFNVIVGCLAKNPFNHFRPAACLLSLKPVRLFTLADWKANWQTLFIVRGNPLS